MAGSTSSGATGQLPIKSEISGFLVKAHAQFSRRQWTLISITALLNVLFISSLLCIVTQIYQIASDPGDTANIASEVLMVTSAVATLGYITVHCIFSLKQRIWKHQGRHPSGDKKTSYIAIRFAVTLCTLWLLTGGWNMIIVARRPTCLSEAPDLPGWEAGTTCQVARVGVAFAMIALMAACALFGMLTIISRPFEAHLLNYNCKPSAPTPTATPSVSRRGSPLRSASAASDRHRKRRMSFQTHRSTPSNYSNTDVDTLDLNFTSLPERIVAPAPIRSLGLGIFTSHAQPPPLPAAFAAPSRSSSVEPPPLFQPSVSTSHLPLPPRISSTAAPGGFVPLSIPLQFSASNWRAVHPSAPSPLGPAASRSYSHLPSAISIYNYPSHRSGYSRSSISLTRPHRLSTVTPAGSVGWSSRSGSTSPDKGPGGAREQSDGARRATAGEIAFAILNGTCIPGTVERPGRHARHVSAPDTSAGARQKARMPQLQEQTQPDTKIVRSSSAILPNVLDTIAPIVDRKAEQLRSSFDRILPPIRKMRSEASIRYSSAPEIPIKVLKRITTVDLAKTGGKTKEEEKGDFMSAVLAVGQRKTTFEEAKNKPLPRIASL